MPKAEGAFPSNELTKRRREVALNVKFYELAIGAGFAFRGQSFVKEAMCMARDEQRLGTIFMGETIVVSDGPLLPPEIAAEWKPYRGQWAAMIDAMVTSA